MISKGDIEGLAKLARLDLSESEKETLGKDVSSILNYVSQVSAIVSTHEGPILPPHHNSMRADTPRLAGDPLLGTKEAIRNQFPTIENGYNVVRKIIQKDE